MDFLLESIMRDSILMLSPLVNLATFMLCHSHYILNDWKATDLAFKNSLDSYRLVIGPLFRIYATAIGK